MIAFLLLCLSTIQPSHSISSNLSAFAIPVTDVVLSNNNVMRGIPLSIGTPAQNFSFLPQTYFNDTWIYNTSASFCTWGPTSSTACLTSRGGLYDKSGSSTSSGPMSVLEAGGDSSDTQQAVMAHVWINAFVTDILGIGNSTLKGYPLGMPGFDLNSLYNCQNNIGLGWNSTFLNALVAAKKITSRSYSWWWGLTGATSPVQMDGQIVFGGYDAAKIQGPSYTQALSAPSLACASGMFVTISDILLDFPNGTSASILSPGSISTCIVPDYPLILTLNWDPYYSEFETLTNTQNVGRASGSTAFYGMLYNSEEVYQGGLTIKLTNGLQVSFPNDLLVVPPSVVAQDGSIETNSSVLEVLIDPTLGINELDTAIIGRHFFQAAYLTVDYDSGTFTLSQANPTEDTDLVTLGKDSSTSQINSTSNNGTHYNPSSPHQSTMFDTSATGGKQSIPIGIIVGAVLGSILGTAVIIMVAIVCFWRRKRSKGNAVTEEGSKKFEQRDASRNSGYVPNSQLYEAMSGDMQEMAAETETRELASETKAQELLSRDRMTWSRKGDHAGSYSPVELG